MINRSKRFFERPHPLPHLIIPESKREYRSFILSYKDSAHQEYKGPNVAGISLGALEKRENEQFAKIKKNRKL